MPAKYHLTWDGKNRRWRKLYKGTRYVVSCQQLGAPENKEGSYQAANEWWERKRAEIDGQSSRPSYGGILDRLEFRRDWCRKHADPLGSDLWDVRIRELLKQPFDEHLDPTHLLLSPGVEDRMRNIEARGGTVPDFGDSLGLEYQLGDGRVWADRERSEYALQAPEGFGLPTKVDEYLARRRAEAEAGQIKATSYMAIRDRLPHFKTFCGEMDASKIDERTLSGYHQHLLFRVGNKELSPHYAAHLLSASKTFIRHLWRERILEHLPRNLDALKIAVALREIPTFNQEKLGVILDAASERTRLYLLLMLNIGAYQMDVASIKKSQVDLTSGRITRKRTKTEGQVNAPKVSYLLWDETHRLLKKCWSDDPVLALTNMNGTPLYRRPLNEDGSVGLTDNIKKAYERVCDKLNIETTPLMYLRKTSASLLETHKDFGRYSQYFLGQAPQGVTEGRYAKPSPDGFDTAIRWLGLQYGYSTSR